MKSSLKEDVIKIDLNQKTLSHLDNGNLKELSLYGPEAFELISKLWLTSGWANKYSYSFTWMGRPVIQTPEDLLRVQEFVFEIKPDVIIETGIAHGGSLIFYASLLKLLGKGKVIGIDIDIRSHNKEAITEHPLYPLIELIEADSVAETTIEKVKTIVGENESVLVVLDSCHQKDHVLKELNLYSELVSSGSYILVFDGIMKDLVGVPGAKDDWYKNNPLEAIEEFLQTNNNFKMVEPPFLFNESEVTKRITYFPGGILQKIS